MNIIIPLPIAAITPLLHNLITFLVALLVAIIVYWAISLFVTEPRIRQVIGAIIALILIIVAIALFLPGL